MRNMVRTAQTSGERVNEAGIRIEAFQEAGNACIAAVQNELGYAAHGYCLARGRRTLILDVNCHRTCTSDRDCHRFERVDAVVKRDSRGRVNAKIGGLAGHRRRIGDRSSQGHGGGRDERQGYEGSPKDER